MILHENIRHVIQLTNFINQIKEDSTSRLPSKESSRFEHPPSLSQIELENISPIRVRKSASPVQIRLNERPPPSIDYPFILIIIFKIIVLIDRIAQFFLAEKFIKLRMLQRIPWWQMIWWWSMWWLLIRLTIMSASVRTIS